jgi:hypothetical protein
MAFTSPEDHELLASLTLWWCTETMPRSLYPYRNRPPAGQQSIVSRRENFIKVPTGYSDNPQDVSDLWFSPMLRAAS